MAASTFVDGVQIYSNSAGTGDFVLGDAVPTYRGVQALTDGDTYSYAVQIPPAAPGDAGQFEFGQGVYDAAALTLTRTSIESSNGSSPIAMLIGIPINFTVRAADFAATDQVALAAAVLNAQGSAADAAADAALTAADRTATHADRVAADAAAVTVAADVVTSGNNAAAAASSASSAATSATTATNGANNALGAATVAVASKDAAAASATSAASNASATAADRTATAADVTSTHADVVMTATDRAAAQAAAVSTAADRTATHSDKLAADADAAATAADRVQTGSDRSAASASASAAGTSATNAASSATAASGSASTASTAATNAGNSASAASTSAGNAAASATNASNSATAASGSASTASTAATNAGNSATAAAGSATTAGSAATASSGSASAASASATAADVSNTSATASANSAATSASNAAISATAAAASAATAANPVILTVSPDTGTPSYPIGIATGGGFNIVGGTDKVGYIIGRFGANNKGSVNYIYKSRATTLAGVGSAAVQLGDRIVSDAIYADSGTQLGHAGQIQWVVDAAPSYPSEIAAACYFYIGTGLSSGQRIVWAGNSLTQMYIPGPGGTVPTPGSNYGANLVFGPGAAAANGAMVKWTLSGTVLLTTPEAGAMEADSAGALYMTNSAGKRRRLVDADTGNMTVAASTGAGTSPTISIVNVPNGCRVTVLAGTSPALANVFTVTYANAFATDSVAVMSPANNKAAQLAASIYTASDQNGFTLACFSTGLTAGQTYIWDFIVSGK